MKIRSETVAMLRLIDDEEFPVTVADVARRLDQIPQTVRNQLNRLERAGLLIMERRYTPPSKGVAGRPTLQYFRTSAKAKQILAERPHIPAAAARKTKPVNSVFSLAYT